MVFIAALTTIGVLASYAWPSSEEPENTRKTRNTQKTQNILETPNIQETQKRFDWTVIEPSSLPTSQKKYPITPYRSSLPQSTQQKSSFISRITLPPYAWRQLLQYLSKTDKNACALVSRRMGILVLSDPSAELETMQKKCSPLVPLSRQEFGPSHHFLFSKIENINDEYSLENIFNVMNNDEQVAKNVLDICKVEAQYPQYIPIYHATTLPAYFYTLFTRMFLSTAYLPNECLPCNNPMIRFPSAEAPKTVEGHFQKFPVKDCSEAYDWNPEVAAFLLACNMNLFSNLDSPKECTWNFYLNATNINPPDKEKFFSSLCKKYRLSPQREDYQKFSDLYDKLNTLKQKFIERFNLKNRGMILQILIPPTLIDKIAYASFAYGIPYSLKFPSSPAPLLSQKCIELRSNSRVDTQMQVRFLTQSLFENNEILTFVHGCELFSKETSQQEQFAPFFAAKNKILDEIHAFFTKMILFRSDCRT